MIGAGSVFNIAGNDKATAEIMEIDLREIYSGLPGLSKVSGQHLYEGCVVCLSRQHHNSDGTPMQVIADREIATTLFWEDIFNDQLDRTWKDQFYATEHGAVCISLLTALKLTDYTIIEKSARKNGFDYWLGEKDDILFQRKARLEVSGIFNGTDKDVRKRFKVKIKQTDKSDSLYLPAYVGIVEFSKPMTHFGEKK